MTTQDKPTALGQQLIGISQAIEEVVRLLELHDSAKTDQERSALFTVINAKAGHLPSVEGYALETVDKEMLVACFDEEQARQVQMELLRRGDFSRVRDPAFYALIDYVHPKTDPGRIAERIVNRSGLGPLERF